MSLYPRSSLIQPVSVIETAAEEAHRKLKEAKRLKQKLSRIAPLPNLTDSSDDKHEIDDEILERCTRCPPHRKRRGVFRPLIGNDGEFLCDSCYQKEFPATAFLDETTKSNWQRRGSNIADKIRNGASDMVADALGKTELPGDVDHRSNIDFDFPSEVECRMCLDKGIFRRCCSSYYCHPCYYQRKSCPGCEQEVPLTGIAAKKEDHPGKLAVRLSWAVSILIASLTLIILCMYYWNEVTSPRTVMGHSCRGFFPTCELSVCIDYDGGHGYGEGGSWIPAAEPYRICNRETTTNQVVASACIYDHEMYAWSEQLIGYDLCTSSPREEHTRPNDVSSVNPLLLYAESAGIYVFDDDFEFPLKASAPWHEIINGEYSDACGVNSASPTRGKHYQPVENKNALVFTGVHTRHAMTEMIQVPYGGTLEFYLKMGPLSNDPYAKCKPAYDGDVTLEFCINDDECTEFMLFKTWKYRGDTFHFLSIEIPNEAKTNSTRFRFRQKSFDASRDHWAIDDVRIHANLHPSWQESTAFSKRQKVSGMDIQQAACCYGTDKCSIFDQKDTAFQKSECKSIPEFHTDKQISRLKSSELYILFSLLATFAKVAYYRVYEHYTSMAPSEKNFTAQSAAAASDQFPKMTFHTVTQLTWQYTVASMFGIELLCVVLRFFISLDLAKCFTGEACYADGSVIVFIIALALDVRAVKIILCRVLVIEKPVEFLVDPHPDNSLMQIEGENIPLKDVTAINKRNAGFMWIMSLCYVVGGIPFASASLNLRSYHLHGSSEVWYTILGLNSVLREIFGVAFVAKFILSVQWLFTFRQDDREDFGRALRRKGLMQQSVIGASLTSIIVMSAIFARGVGNSNAWTGLVAFASCIVFGGLMGIIVGIMHGLPVIPEAYLTCWPSACYCISYYDRAHCPCLFSCTSCGDMNSRRVMLILTVEEMFALKKMLSGSTT